MRYRKGLEWRCFEYATRLATHLRVPALTTVVFIEKPGPRELAHREILRGRVVHGPRFEVLRLWEMAPERPLRLGPGTAALIGPAEKTALPLVARAARRIQREALDDVERSPVPRVGHRQSASSPSVVNDSGSAPCQRS